MALKDLVKVGTVLPHRTATPLDLREIRIVAERAEALGFRDLWVTENTLDENYSVDPFLILTYAAAHTAKIGLGISVVVLPMHHPVHVAHAAATLDFISNGRAILGVGLGPPHDYADFQVPMERRVRRFTEGVELIKALWTRPVVDFQGEIYQLAKAGIALRPVQQPHPPLWLGGAHENAVKRAVRYGSGWMGAGAQSAESFFKCLSVAKQALQESGRDPAGFELSKRIHMSVDRDAKVAQAELRKWFGDVYHKPENAQGAGICGTPEQVREQLEPYLRGGATHLVLNTVTRHAEEIELLAEVMAL